MYFKYGTKYEHANAVAYGEEQIFNGKCFYWGIIVNVQATHI